MRHSLLYSGFTLIEILISITVMSILLAIGAPSMQHFVIENRLNSTVNQFVAATIFARSEAIKRGRPVQLCRSADSANTSLCVGTAKDARDANDWGSGWVVMLLDDQQVLLRQGALPDKVRVTGTKKIITYNADGNPGASFGNLVFAYNDQYSRIVCMSRSGRVRVLVGVTVCA
ncbi:GspH/FimT family pseudopilin [Glaciimonas soli]|uniref:Type II secretion system protein H n=1 Tax=Glaciimonas soli TaxID=2590999 RepID=A0A843YT19_9BURK|nr:GspH/FimT family pseudopilin [Glaciimonas soli]MQR01137.1 prepilin-type N-terminal cleavage/methylation domain-containing protein [Glaciimonas soli]